MIGIDVVPVAAASSGGKGGLGRALAVGLARAGANVAIRARRPPRNPARRNPSTIRPVVQRTVGAMTDVPVFVRNRRLDIVTANRLGRAIYAPLYPDPHRPHPSAQPRPILLPRPPRPAVPPGLGHRLIRGLDHLDLTLTPAQA